MERLTAYRVAALLAVWLATTGFADLQQPPSVKTISGNGTCSTCRLSIVPLLTFGDTTGGHGELVEPVRGTVFQDRDGTYYLTSFKQNAMVTRYSALGRFIDLLGRQGQGPGEFIYPRVFGIVGDSVFVVDPTNSRMSVMNRRDKGLVRQQVIPELLSLPFSIVRLANGGIVMNATVRTPDVIGFPLHAFSADGQKHLSFGSTDGTHRPDRPRSALRHLAPGRLGGVWVSHMESYRIERYAEDYSLREVIEREVTWFPAQVATRPPAQGPPMPPPAVISMREDARGLLWVLATVPGKNWRAAYTDSISERPGMWAFPVSDYEALYDSVIEVFDVSRGQLLATTTVSHAAMGFVDDSTIAARQLSGDRIPLVRILRIRLDGRWPD